MSGCWRRERIGELWWGEDFDCEASGEGRGQEDDEGREEGPEDRLEMCCGSS